MNRPRPHVLVPGPRNLRLLDLAGLVVGYGMAAILVKALWPGSIGESPAVLAVLGLEYSWLGLAMGGPIVLLIDRRPYPDRSDAPARYTWAETAWLLIGGYWIGLTALVAPAKLPVHPLFGLFPIVAALFLRIFGRPRRPPDRDEPPAWTHRVAVALIVSWPLAWAALILLSRS
jgi:hypothetical protein